MKLSWRRTVQWFKLYDFRSTRAVFYGDLSEMYRRGEAMLSFLEGELANAKATKQTSRAAALRIILARFTSGAEGGRLEYLLHDVVPAGDAMMIAGVERSASKADALLALVQAVEQAGAMKKTILAYSVGPLIILPICIALIKVVANVLKQIEDSTPVYVRDQVWSGFNGVAKIIGDFSIKYGAVTLIVLIAATALLIWSLPRWTGPGRLRADKLPVYSLYRDFQSGLLFSSMAMLLKTGGSLGGTLEDLARRASPVMRWQLRRVLRALDDAPTKTIQAFSRGILSPYLLARATTLHRTAPSFADVLIELGTTEGDRVLARVKRAALVANIAILSVLVTLATILALATITVPASFANAMDPANMMMAKKEYDATHRAPTQAPAP